MEKRLLAGQGVISEGVLCLSQCRLVRQIEAQNCGKHDLSCEKEKSNRLQSDLTLLVRERNIEVDELNETIASLQGKISTVEKINDQLRASNMCINLETANNIKPNHIDEKSVSFNYNSCRTKLAISKQSQTEHQDHNNRTFNDFKLPSLKTPALLFRQN